MSRKVFLLAFLLMTLSFSFPAALAQEPPAPEHFYNEPQNLNPDPNYVPGEWPFPDPFEARTIYQNKKKELAVSFPMADPAHLSLLNLGEISFSVLKNETAPVLGYFREWAGALRTGEKGPERMEMLIDINSLDTGVPGRNNRILDLFFQSKKADFGTVSIRFDQFNLGGISKKNLEDGEIHPIRAAGEIVLNGAAKPLRAALNVQKREGVWEVKTAQPIEILISDFDFSERIFHLMKSCSHKSLGNRVQLQVELYLK